MRIGGLAFRHVEKIAQHAAGGAPDDMVVPHEALHDLDNLIPAFRACLNGLVIVSAIEHARLRCLSNAVVVGSIVNVVQRDEPGVRHVF